MQAKCYHRSQIILILCAMLLSAWCLSCDSPTENDGHPILVVDKNVLDFNQTSTSQSLTISNAGGGILHFSIEVPTGGWVIVSQREGSITNGSVIIDVRIDRETYPSGHQETIMVITTEKGGRKEVVVRASIRLRTGGAVLPPSLNFGETSDRQTHTLRNDGGESLGWSATSPQEWIAISPASGALPPGDEQVVTISIDRTKLGSGSNHGAVDFTSGGGSHSVTVLAMGSAFLGTLSASPRNINFYTRITRESLTIRRIGGTGTMDWTAEASADWIVPDKISGSLLTGESQIISIGAERGDLDPGTYQGSLIFRWVGGATEVTVSMSISGE